MSTSQNKQRRQVFRAVAAWGLLVWLHAVGIPCRADVERLEIRSEFPVRVAQFSLDGKQLALGTSKGTIEVWRITPPTKLQSWKAHNGGVQSVVFNARGILLASEASDRRVAVWKVADGAKVWEAADPSGTSPLAEAHGENSRIAFSEDDKRVAVFGWFWDAETGQQLERYGARGPISIRSGRLATNSTKGIHVLNVADLSEILDIKEDAAPRVEISPNGEFIAIGRSLFGAGASLKRIRDGKNVSWPLFAKRWVFGVAFSPDSKQLALSGQDELVRVYDTSNGNELLALETPGTNNYWVGFSPDGKLLAAVGVNEIVRFWSMPDGKPLFD